jgi:hypothetical protein
MSLETSGWRVGREPIIVVTTSTKRRIPIGASTARSDERSQVEDDRERRIDRRETGKDGHESPRERP